MTLTIRKQLFYQHLNQKTGKSLTIKYPFNVCDTDCYKTSVCFYFPPLPFYHTLVTNIEVPTPVTINSSNGYNSCMLPQEIDNINPTKISKGRGISAISIEFQQNHPPPPHPAITDGSLVSLLWFQRNVTITIIDSKCHLKYELAKFSFQFFKEYNMLSKTNFFIKYEVKPLCNSLSDLYYI